MLPIPCNLLLYPAKSVNTFISALVFLKLQNWLSGAVSVSVVII